MTVTVSRAAGFFLLALIVAFPPLSAAAAPTSEMSLRMNSSVAPEPLKTEDVARLDPGQVNPHLSRWVLSRDVNMSGLVVQHVSSKANAGKANAGAEAETDVRITGGALEASTRIYLRPEGPWYTALRDFPCGAKTPSPDFAILDETRRTADAARKAWEKLITDEKPVLGGRLRHIVAPNEKSLRSKAQRVFLEWLHQTDRKWRLKVVELRKKEWAAYARRARAAHVCPKKKPGPPLKADAWMEKEDTSGLTVIGPLTKPEVRAPARRWDGYFSVRMDIRIGETPVNGQFVIDPGAPRSVVSSDWLLSQGVQPGWLEIPEAIPETVRISAGQEEHTGLARIAVAEAILSGYELPLRRFGVFATDDLFDLPDFIAPCCSGVLGQDFLREQMVEFRPGKPNEVILWPAATHRPPEDYHWVEMRIVNEKRPEIRVSCTERARAEIGKKACQSPLHAVLEASAPIFFDLPHGKLWYSPKEREAPTYVNRSGVTLGYGFEKADRVLRVLSIQRNARTEELLRAGLKKGTIISAIDGIGAEELDLWQVNRRLSGVEGGVVTFKWATKDGDKMAPLELPAQPR